MNQRLFNQRGWRPVDDRVGELRSIPDNAPATMEQIKE
jgi:hypothetical protein